MISILGKNNSLFNQFLAEMRDVSVQSDRMRFRKNLERAGELFAYEISKKLPWQKKEVTTPLGVSEMPLISEWPVLVTILRAGIPFHQGLLNFFDRADSGFITAYRKTKKSNDFEIRLEYVSTPDLSNRIVIVNDPMLSTGRTMTMACKEILSEYEIKELHIASVIASAEGVNHIRANFPKAKLWLGAVDEEMTSKAFIVPGLGDAGDLAFGEKT